MNTALEALKGFKLEGAIEKVAPFGSGHINDTYKVESTCGNYLLQKVNTKVFQNTETLENNLKLLEGLQSPVFAKHITTESGTCFLVDESGCWKLQEFVSNAYGPTTPSNLTLVEEVGKGFGMFTKATASLKAKAFDEAIPNFHSLKWRLEQLDEAIALNIANRKETAQSLIDQVNAFGWITDYFNRLVDRGLPIRVCHNDTKIDNILLSQGSDEFRHVIDLDTTGPGYVLSDFGDMMRTLLTPTKEAELDESKIEIREGYLEALKSGYLSSCAESLSPLEIENLEFGGLYMTYMQAIRFLADYVNGDTYYKISFTEENYIRARNQLTLLQLMHTQIFSGKAN
ncbi:aminoglycoside phosphotransferase family protein [Roseivirga sp.]|uniref:phosphotransferase enzyme family protein n=1 Tax=Roseivirga sp. TaxID=1964215 RepID=UPI002B27A5E9|nr:aminoglycoside phosphotransferase family protein [Roseivirga sp.]